MARRISTSQFRSKLRQAEQKQRQAINRYNQAVRTHNQKLNQAINQYNQEVRAHNARVRAYRQKLTSALNRLKSLSATTTTRHITFRTSVTTLHERYTRFEEHSAPRYEDTANAHIVDLVDREDANNLDVMNALLSGEEAGEQDQSGIEGTTIGTELVKISPELDARWKGAIYALNPRNPDAARHFCTSAREIFTQILETKAPDNEVLATLPGCDLTEQGKPTRRSKIRFFLHRRGLNDTYLEEFVEEDMENIVQLFRVFNDGTHGSAGVFTFTQLVSIKRRVEDGIAFLANVIGP